MMKKKEILKEIEALKLLLEFHSTYRIIEDSARYENHVNDILDRMLELKKMLEELN